MAGDIVLYGPDNQPLPPRARPGRALAERMGGGHSFYDAASLTHPDIADWRPMNPSAQSALTHQRDAIAARLHDLDRNNGVISSAIDKKIAAIVGSGWTLKAKPIAAALGISPAAARDLSTQIEAAWAEYSADFEACDAGQRMTMGQQQALRLRHRLLDGESLTLSKWEDRGGGWRTCFQIIDPDRLSNPNLYFDSVGHKAGVDLGASGEPLAYHIRTAHPGDIGVIGAIPWKWERVPRKLPNGRWQVVHSFEAKRAGQVRGEPPMAAIVHEVKMQARYKEAELQAALINAILAVFVKSNGDQEQIAEALSGGGDGISNLQAQRGEFYDNKKLKMSGAQVNFLYPTDSIELSHPSHPNAGYENFHRAGMREIAAAAGVSYEQLTGDYSQTNYSSFRGAMLEIWRGFTSLKNNFIAQDQRPLYANWLEEAIAIGKVKPPKGCKAFREARMAWTAAEWLGPARGWVDPLKEANAKVELIGAGISTYGRELAEQGIDFEEHVAELAYERQTMLAAGIDPDALLRPKPPVGTQPGEDPLTPKPAPGKGGKLPGNPDQGSDA